MGWSQGTREKLGAKLGKVVGQGQGFGFRVEVLYVGLEERACGVAEGLVLNTLELLYVCSAGGGEPYWGGVGDDGLEDGFVGEEDGLLVLAPGCPSEGLEDLETTGCSGCYIVDMWGEGE